MHAVCCLDLDHVKPAGIPGSSRQGGPVEALSHPLLDKEGPSLAVESPSG